MVRPPRFSEVVGLEWAFADSVLAHHRCCDLVLLVGPAPPHSEEFFFRAELIPASTRDWRLFALDHLDYFPIALFTAASFPVWALYPVLQPEGLVAVQYEQRLYTKTELGDLQ